MAHYVYYTAKNGDLVDVVIFCSEMCRTDYTSQLTTDTPNQWECVTIITQETDYDEFCANCGEFIHHGLQCPNECVRREPDACSQCGEERAIHDNDYQYKVNHAFKEK